MTDSDRTPDQNPGRVASQVIEALIAGRGIRTDDVAKACGLTRSTFYNRLNKGDWRFSELLRIAAVLDEPFSSFIDGLGGRFRGLPDQPSSARDTSQSTREDLGNTHRCDASALLTGAAA